MDDFHFDRVTDRYNVIIAPSYNINFDEIVQDYAELAMDCKNYDEMEKLLHIFLDELSVIFAQELLLSQTLENIEKLKKLEEIRKQGYNEEDE